MFQTIANLFTQNRRFFQSIRSWEVIDVKIRNDSFANWCTQRIAKYEAGAVPYVTIFKWKVESWWIELAVQSIFWNLRWWDGTDSWRYILHMSVVKTYGYLRNLKIIDRRSSWITGPNICKWFRLTAEDVVAEAFKTTRSFVVILSSRVIYSNLRNWNPH